MSSTFWDERYRREGFAYGRDPNQFLRAEAHRIPMGGRVLCLAEGEGRNAVFLAQLGHAVTAVDFSAEGLRKAETLARENGVTIHTVHADLATYDIEEDSFAGIVSIFAHLPPTVRARVHAQVPRALVAGGVFLLEAYTPRQQAYGTGGPKDPEWLMTLEGVTREINPLAVLLGKEVEREVQEGDFHTGMAATVQIAATRALHTPI